MAERKPFLLRLDPRIYDALQQWAAADLRSLNAQIEFVLREALAGSGRLPRSVSAPLDPPGPKPRKPSGG